MHAEGNPHHPWTSAWSSCSIAQLGAIYGGGTPRREEASFWNGSIPWITPGELSSNRSKYLTAARESITDRGLRSSSANLVPRDTLLVTTRASLGFVALAGMPLATNQGFRCVVFNDPRDAHFYYHFSRRLKGELERRASGTTFLEISGREFAAIIVPSPPRAEKDRIADILDTVDDAIRQTERVIAKLEQVKAGMLQDLLTRGIDDNGEVRDPERHPEQFKDSPLGRIPENWDVLSLRECAEPQGFFDGDWIEAPDLSASGIRLIQTGNVGIGRFEDRADFHRFISPATFRRLNCSWVRPGDVLICRLAEPIGRACVVPPHVGDSVTAVDCTVFRGGSKVDRDFVVAVLNSAPSLRRAQDQSGGTTRQRISRSSLGRLPFPLPPRQEQRRIADILDQHQDRVLREGEALAKLRATKRALADDLLTGRVRVNPREEVPA